MQLERYIVTQIMRTQFAVYSYSFNGRLLLSLSLLLLLNLNRLRYSQLSFELTLFPLNSKLDIGNEKI